MVLQKIGIRLESLGLPLRRGLSEARRMGASGVQVDAVGDLAPGTLSQTGRREFRNLLRTHNLELTALGCPLRRGLDVAENQEARIDLVRKVMTLSFELGPRITIVEPGLVPEDPNDPAGSRMTEVLLALGQHGDRVGAVLALETGPQSGETLARYLATFDTGGLGVNLDPANLLMNGFDPYENATALRGRVVHVHAKDARVSGVNRVAKEVPLGHGDIDWLRFLGTLEEIDYHGWLTIERESGDDRIRDVAEGVAFLKRFVH
jgi:sugar phosphate isomerase/epimerase